MRARTFPRIAGAFLVSIAAVTAPEAQEAGAPLSAAAPPLTPELRARLAAADIAPGAAYFERKCSQCHDGAKEGGHGKGPHLWNVMGRRAGSAPGFAYSDAMRAVGRDWSYATLDYYLSDTERAVPGRAMNFAGIKDDALRASVVMYLRTLSDTPAPLP
jgi:cytochrome c